MHKAKVWPTGFGTTFASVFVLTYWLRKFPLSAVANRFELRCQSKQHLLLYYKICPCNPEVARNIIINYSIFLFFISPITKPIPSFCFIYKSLIISQK